MHEVRGSEVAWGSVPKREAILSGLGDRWRAKFLPFFAAECVCEGGDDPSEVGRRRQSSRIQFVTSEEGRKME